MTVAGCVRGSLRCALVGMLPTVAMAACAVGNVAPAEVPRAAAPLPSEVSRRFDYAELGAPVTSWSCVRTHGEDAYEVFAFKGEATLPGDRSSIPVEGEYWQSKVRRGPLPAVIVTPILGGGNDVARLIAREFAEAGMHGVIVWRGVKVLAPHWPADEVERAIRRGIVCRRRVLDWLETRPEVDRRRISAFGVSMGGIATAILASVEPRIHSSVIALAGGDLASVVMTSDEGRVVTYRKSRMAADKLDGPALEARLRSMLVSDPVEVARFVDPRSFLVFVARADTTVPTRNQLLLREALGRPRTIDLPTSHYSTMLYVPLVRAESTAWLLERMREPNPRLEPDVTVKSR